MSQAFPIIALAGKYDSVAIGESVLKLASFLTERGHEVILARQTAENLDIPDYRMEYLSDIGGIASVVVVLGGDGTMLSIGRVLARSKVPMIGINQGRLGFLADIPLDSMEATLADMLEGRFLSEERILLEASIYRNHQKIYGTCAFNDVVISKAATGRLIEFEVYVDGDFVYTQRSDGVILSTPTGSTAYALSAGGPILYPTQESVLLVPICAHTLTARPISVDSSHKVDVVLTYAGDARVHFDGQGYWDMQVGDRVRVEQASHKLRLLHPLNYSFYETLRQKLHWAT